MKKLLKVLKIIGICLLAACIGGFVVLYIVNKDLAEQIIAQLVDILNRPLPIIGVTTLAILIFIWKVIITTNYGKKKLAQYDEKVKEIEQAKEDFENNANEKVEELLENLENIKKQLSHACELSTNKKIKDFGKELEYGKETIECKTKAN